MSGKRAYVKGCKLECCAVREEEIPVDGDDRLTLQSARVTRNGDEHSYPDYFTWHIGGEAGGYTGSSFVQATSKRGSIYHTYTLDAKEAGQLRDWLNKHVIDISYVPNMHKIV